MDREELSAKLHQIEEQARCTLEEFPKKLANERQRMIIALARHVRTELENPLDLDPDRTLERPRH